ncbi:hypothetical protein LguiB_021184 [Lonicera macranthoides]
MTGSSLGRIFLTKKTFDGQRLATVLRKLAQTPCGTRNYNWAALARTALFLGAHDQLPRGVTHPGIALVHYSLNFGVLMGSEASELPKGLVLVSEYTQQRCPPQGRIDIVRSGTGSNTRPHGFVLAIGSNRVPRGLVLVSEYHAAEAKRSPTGEDRYCPVRAAPLDSNRAALSLRVLFLGAHDQLPRGVTHPGIALVHYSLNFGVLMGSEASELLRRPRPGIRVPRRGS